MSGRVRHVPLCGRFEVDVHLVGEGSKPSQDVTELVQLLLRISFPDCLSQLADFLGQPRDRCRDATLSVGLAVEVVHQFLERSNLHGRTLGQWGRAQRLDVSQFAAETEGQRGSKPTAWSASAPPGGQPEPR